MKQDEFAAPGYKEGLEADAVCGQCGSVNPEGTLICKMCGNNLRDQRMLRIAADEMLEAEEETANRSAFVVSGLSILGILLVLWLGLNAGRLANILTNPSGLDTGLETVYTDPEAFWTGPDSTRYHVMHEELTDRFPTESDADNALMSATPMEQIAEGHYVLYRRMGTAMRFVGAAVVKEENGVWHYTAALRDGVEVRGHASPAEHILTSLWDEAGALYDGQYYAVSGTAATEADGSVTVSGESSYNRQPVEAVAYRYSGLR